MSTKQDAREFDEFTDDEFDALTGDGDQVLTNSYVMNTGKALVEPDLYPAGDYVLHEEPGVVIWAHKKEDGSVNIRMQVADALEANYEKELAHHRTTFELTKVNPQYKDSPYPIYHLKTYHVALLLAKYGVHPQIDEQKFEQVLWNEMPRAWIDESRAPRRFII